MGYIGQSVFTGVITSSAEIDAGTIEVSDLSTAAQDELGKIDLYGFKKTNGTGTQLEDLILTKTNGTDNVDVATNDGTQSDLYDESFFAKKGLTFSVNSDGELLVTI
jgi:hypothetical protein|tara:strand:+ start:767 stop:1087 length:321 start_codon:yes stop_codon:yes gene_type:complete